jgi:hypothetical protein
MQHPDKYIDETLRIGAYIIRVQPLQHVQHPDLFLQHPYMKHLQYISETFKTLETNTCNMRFFTLLPYEAAQERGAAGSSQPAAEDAGAA